MKINKEMEGTSKCQSSCGGQARIALAGNRPSVDADKKLLQQQKLIEIEVVILNLLTQPPLFQSVFQLAARLYIQA